MLQRFGVEKFVLVMRKLIVKYLALSYRVRLFGKEFAFVRAANVVVPMLLLLGYALINSESYPTPDLFTWVMLGVTLVLWSVIIVYLKAKPVKWNELDREQKWFWGNGIRMGKLPRNLTKLQMDEYESIDKRERYDKSKFHNIKAFLVNPICVVILLLVIYL